MQAAAMATKDFIVFDSDSHVVEPPALWEKYLDPEYRTLGKHALGRLGRLGRRGAGSLSAPALRKAGAGRRSAGCAWAANRK
jgi:hypothetical protein